MNAMVLREHNIVRASCKLYQEKVVLSYKRCLVRAWFAKLPMASKSIGRVHARS